MLLKDTKNVYLLDILKGTTKVLIEKVPFRGLNYTNQMELEVNHETLELNVFIVENVGCNKLRKYVFKKQLL